MFLSIKESNYELALLVKQHPYMISKLRCIQTLRHWPMSDIGRVAGLQGVDKEELERMVMLYRVGGMKLLFSSDAQSFISRGRALLYSDLCRLLTPSELSEAGHAAIMELLNYSQASRVPDGVKVIASNQQNLNGNRLKYPNSKESDNEYYGFGRGVIYTVLDIRGRAINNLSFRLSERVVLKTWKPNDAKRLAGSLKQERGSVEPDENGVFYDDIGPLFKMRDEYVRFSRMGNFEANYHQTLYVTDSRGQRYEIGVNSITMTNYKVEVVPQVRRR
jgi:hypothetical protein